MFELNHKHMFRISLIALVFLLGFSSCKYDKADVIAANPCDTTNATFTKTVQPILKANCTDAGCHTTANANAGIALDTYAATMLAVPQDQLLNAVKYITGGSKNMPPTQKMADCDVNKIEAWIRRGAPEN
jgi:hypothetical protein